MNGNDWKCYRTLYSAQSPISIGWHSLGMIRRTRYYIPARNIWGAMVAGLVPTAGGGLSPPESYEKCQDKLKLCARFTYFFAMPSPDGDAGVFRPRFTEGEGLRYGPLNPEESGDRALYPEEFERRFVASQTSAALLPSSLSAEEGALHESEFLADRKNRRPALYFVGHILIRDVPDALSAAAVRAAAENIWVGADRTYGWGWLKLREFTEVQNDVLFGGFKLIGQSPDGPLVQPLAESDGHYYLPAHLVCATGNCSNLQGDIEMLGGRDYRPDRGSGQKVLAGQPCWVPGSRGSSNGSAPVFCITGQGRWHSAD